MKETNTLIIYELPRNLIEEVRELINTEQHAGMVQCIQLRFLRRILAVFDTSASAKAAMPLIKAKILAKPGCETVHIGFSMNNNTNETLPVSHLPLPARGKLLFISPPVSPPNEWNGDVEEEQPNQRTHYESEFNEKLHAALNMVQEGSCPAISPVDSESGDLHGSSESPNTVTIFEAQSRTPALKVTSHE